MKKSKKLIIFQERSTGNFFIRATKINKNGNFVLKSDAYGLAKSRNISNEELGRCVREILNNCD